MTELNRAQFQEWGRIGAKKKHQRYLESSAEEKARYGQRMREIYEANREKMAAGRKAARARKAAIDT